MNNSINQPRRWMHLVMPAILTTVFVVAAQAQTATLSGTITDVSGGAVPDAAITARNLATSATRVGATDSSGVYSISNLTIGRYDVTVEKTGFTALHFQNLELTVAQSLTLDGSLTVGTLSQAVEVAGSAVPVIDTADAQISNVVDERAIRELPLITRDPYQLVLLSPAPSRH
jgi:hypothetical protein